VIIKPVFGQTVFDLAIQYYGSVEYVGEVLRNLGSITDLPAPGVNLELLNMRTNPTTEFFASRRPVATGEPV
jgi:hypothetical protein